MTLKQKLASEHPEAIDIRIQSKCSGCPSDYGYPMTKHCDEFLTCKECWNQEFEKTKSVKEYAEQTRKLSRVLHDAHTLICKAGNSPNDMKRLVTYLIAHGVRVEE